MTEEVNLNFTINCLPPEHGVTEIIKDIDSRGKPVSFKLGEHISAVDEDGNRPGKMFVYKARYGKCKRVNNDEYIYLPPPFHSGLEEDELFIWLIWSDGNRSGTFLPVNLAFPEIVAIPQKLDFYFDEERTLSVNELVSMKFDNKLVTEDDIEITDLRTLYGNISFTGKNQLKYRAPSKMFRYWVLPVKNDCVYITIRFGNMKRETFVVKISLHRRKKPIIKKRELVLNYNEEIPFRASDYINLILSNKNQIDEASIVICDGYRGCVSEGKYRAPARDLTARFMDLLHPDRKIDRIPVRIACHPYVISTYIPVAKNHSAVK